MPYKKVIVGLSGGVDSSVAALLLQKQGYNVEAVFMKNWEEDITESNETNIISTADHNSVPNVNTSAHTCSAAQDFLDARAVAVKLNIPLHVVNFSHEYWHRVFQYMLDEYAQGRTPNPDVMCNKEIKFKEFLNYARQLGADCIATGHYARHITITSASHNDANSDSNSNGDSDDNNDKNTVLHKLYKACDLNKDQTYFLYTLNQEQLAATLFPLGDLTKDEVRGIAQQAGLPNHDKKDSTGICFIGERKFKAFLSEYLLAKPGTIINADDGSEMGRHDGLMFYTLGQRQGLGIGGKKNAIAAPWYVAKKDLAQNKLFVTQNSQHPLLMSDILECQQTHWITGKAPTLPLRCAAKVRYRQEEQPCVVTSANSDTNSVNCEEDTKTKNSYKINKADVNNANSANNTSKYRVVFAKPQRAITPGQAVVFYAADGECLGGGTIA